MQWALRIVAVTVLVTGAWALFSPSAPITNYPPKNTTIVAFGDSLVFGQGAQRAGGFVTLLAESLGREIINMGVSGNTTRDGLGRIGDVRDQDPGIVLLLLGGNDYLRKIPESETRDNLAKMIELFQSDGAVVVLLGVRGGIIQDKRSDMYEELSHTYGTPYVEDVLDGLLLKPELMADGIHPNDRGYAVIAERVAELFGEREL